MLGFVVSLGGIDGEEPSFAVADETLRTGRGLGGMAVVEVDGGGKPERRGPSHRRREQTVAGTGFTRVTAPTLHEALHLRPRPPPPSAATAATLTSASTDTCALVTAINSLSFSDLHSMLL